MRLVDFTVVAGVTEEHYGGEGRPGFVPSGKCSE